MNKEEYLTLRELSKIIGLQEGAVRTYLSRSEFTKYYKNIRVKKTNKTSVFTLTENFIKDLHDFLIIKKNKKGAEALKNYWEIYLTMKRQPTIDTCNELEIVKKQYQSLLNRYNEATKINKKLQVIAKICEEPADSMAVLELQDRIKKVLNDE